METIGPATPADIPDLAGLLGILFAQEGDFQPDQANQERGLRLLLDSPTAGAVFVARDESGGRVAGMVSLLFTISTAEGGRVCWLEDMIVSPDRRGGGLGSRLLTHAVDYARVSGFSRITLLTDRVNAGAIRFYGRHGFVPSGMTALRLSLHTPAAAGP